LNPDTVFDDFLSTESNLNLLRVPAVSENLSSTVISSGSGSGLGMPHDKKKTVHTIMSTEIRINLSELIFGMSLSFPFYMCEQDYFSRINLLCANLDHSDDGYSDVSCSYTATAKSVLSNVS